MRRPLPAAHVQAVRHAADVVRIEPLSNQPRTKREGLGIIPAAFSCAGDTLGA
jgi:hypothetical protein